MKHTPIGRRSFIGNAAAIGAAGTLISGVDIHAATTAKKRAICIFTKHLQFLDYDRAAETAATIGFDGLDIPVRPGGHVLPEKVKTDLPKAVAAARMAGLTVPMITTAITSPDSPYAEDVLKTAADLGVTHYRLGYLEYKDELGVAGSLDFYRPQIEALAEMNRALGLFGGYQNHAGTNVGAPVWDLWPLVRGLDPRFIGCQYDIRHATVEGGTCWRLGLELIAPFIGTIVVKDFKWGLVEGKWSIVDTLVGEGMVDFKAYFDILRNLKIECPATMHFEYPHEQTIPVVTSLFRKDLAALKTLLQGAGL